MQNKNIKQNNMKKILSLVMAMMCITMAHAYESPYNNLGTALNKPFKVKGGAGIVQFASAFNNVLPIEMETAMIDRKGGYISYAEEGDGCYNVNMCIWNRKDGKKLFVVSYYINENVPTGTAAGKCSKYHYNALRKGFSPDFKYLCNTGFRSYLYNAQTATLEPMAEFPVNQLPRTGAENDAYFMNLPQTGKDITLIMGLEDETSYHTLVWNGMGWTLAQEPSARVYIKDSTPTNVRIAPKGTIVATLNNNDMIVVDRCENGWMHIASNDYETGDAQEAVFKNVGEKWVHRSTLASNWQGGVEKLLYSSPNKISAVVARFEGIDDENEIKEILDLRNGMIKVRTHSGIVGWADTSLLCGNSLTTCP